MDPPGFSCDHPFQQTLLVRRTHTDAHHPMTPKRFVGVVLLVSGSVSCRSQIFASCGRTCDQGPSPDSEVAKCVARYSKPHLSPADIRAFIEHGDRECFVRGDPKRLADQGRCLPLSLGVDTRNGKALEIVYHCSDVCPDYGGVLFRYANTSRAECCATGGYPRHSPAWGSYEGCAPPELSLLGTGNIRYFPRHPDRPWEPGTTSPCDPTKVVFGDGTAVDEASLWSE